MNNNQPNDELQKAIETIEAPFNVVKDRPWCTIFSVDKNALEAVLSAAKQLQQVEKENETLHKQLDDGFRILFECGYCECGGKIVHHIDEPFFNCDTCNRHGESTQIPLIQKFGIELNKIIQEHDQLKAALEKCAKALSWSIDHNEAFCLKEYGKLCSRHQALSDPIVQAILKDRPS